MHNEPSLIDDGDAQPCILTWRERAVEYLKTRFTRPKPGQALTFAKDELTRAGMFGKDSDYDGMVGHAVMNLIKAHAREGHSGQTNEMAIALFQKLATFTPLTPLTGEDDEWGYDDFTGDGIRQNRRCSRVFQKSGRGTFILDRVIFKEPDGVCYSCEASVQPVTFPLTIPDTIYINVPEDHTFPAEPDEGDIYTIDGSVWCYANGYWIIDTTPGSL